LSSGSVDIGRAYHRSAAYRLSDRSRIPSLLSIIDNATNHAFGSLI
jgi:hypothetical protein